MIVEKEMFLDVDGKQVGMEMTECQMAVRSIGVMQRLYLYIYKKIGIYSVKKLLLNGSCANTCTVFGVA